MALETPNRLVASAVMLIDGPADPGQHQKLRSSNGILRKVSEADTTISSTSGSIAAWELETPVTNDEGIALASLTGIAGGISGIILIPWIAPLVYQTGIPEIDSIAPNLLVTLAAIEATLKGRMSVAVFALPSTAEPIADEPLPVPP
jgi:hypothetical protein